MNDFWIDLANAVIWQAAADYVAALEGLRNGSSWKRAWARKNLAELEAFFRSERFRRMTAVNCEELMMHLREEYENDDVGVFAAGFLAGTADYLFDTEAGRSEGQPLQYQRNEAAG